MENANLQTAFFAAGCFWGVEEIFRTTPGVVETQVGYSGGDLPSPTYEKVSMGKTGHAESVRVVFDPKKISYGEILDVFWNLHDPTQVNRQGPDFGIQYRSIIFYGNPEQKSIAEKSKRELEESEKYDRPIATEIIPASAFYPAEEYHQKYVLKTGHNVC